MPFEPTPWVTPPVPPFHATLPQLATESLRISKVPLPKVKPSSNVDALPEQSTLSDAAGTSLIERCLCAF